MARSKELKVVIVGDADKLNRELRKSSSHLDKFGKQTRLTGTLSSKGFAAMRVGAVGATAAVGGLALAGKRVIDAASDVNESLSKNTVLFGKYAKGVEKFAEDTATSLGISRAAALESTGTFGNLFTALEIGPKKSADMSVALVKLAADMASFNNASPEETLDAIRSGLVGETEPLRRFGVNLNDATLRAEALRMGLVKTTKDSLEPQTKALAVNSLLFKQTGKAQGDFARTSGGAANQQKILNAQFQDAQAKLGEKLLPTFTKGITKVNKFVGEMQSGTGAGGEFVDTLEGIWSETKPIVTWIGRATKNVAEFVKEHPNVGKLAAAIVGVGVAVKGLKFVSAATGFTDLVKAGRSAARTLKRVLQRGGEEAGVAAAENAASGFSSKKGRFTGAGRTAGRLMGRGLSLGLVAGAAGLASEFMDGFVDKIRKEFGEKVANAIQANVPGGVVGRWGRDKIRDLLGIGRNMGGIIPGTGNTDTVPAMLTPGEFVIRKQVVEKFGPTFFAAINDGKAPQMRTGGGIISRANKLDSQRIPYLYGGGHGTKDGYNRSGMDCSASVSYALGISPRVSGALMSFGKPGAGSPNDTKIYANPGHVFAVFNGRGWGTSRENPGGGPGWLSYNHRPGFTIRHLEDGDEKGEAASGEGDPQETAESGKQRRSERQARAGSRLVNKIVGRALRGAAKDSRAQSAIGGVIEDAEGGIGRSERFFGQVKGGRPGDYGEEDLGTAQGRADRISELGELKKLKAAQLARMRKRASALKRLIAKYEKALKQMNAARGKSKGAKRAKISERMKSYDDRLTDYKAELRGLGESIADTQLDIGDLEKDIGEVAATPDGSDATDAISAALSDIDLKERAGLLSPEQAQAARIATLQSAQIGGFGGLTHNELLEVMAQLREATSQANEQQAQANQLTADLIASLAAAKASLDANTAFGQQVSAVTGREAIAIFAEILSGHYGAKIQQRGTMPGSGALSRF